VITRRFAPIIIVPCEKIMKRIIRVVPIKYSGNPGLPDKRKRDMNPAHREQSDPVKQ
jgi:hypothetical protein